ncbi:hypothetical protein HY990_04160 [Candidatus Micrarchaeota archaeon]|nr:hypothetical protein [Candidatus Micrarchaeota archaeon]
MVISELPPELMTPSERSQVAQGRITLTPPQVRQLDDIARIGGVDPAALRRTLENTTITLRPGGSMQTSLSNPGSTAADLRAQEFLGNLLPLGLVHAENGRVVADLSPQNVVRSFMSMGSTQSYTLLHTAIDTEARVAIDSFADRFMPRGDRTENREVVRVASMFIERCRNNGLGELATGAENYMAQTYGNPAAALVRGIALHTRSVPQNDLFSMSNPDLSAIRHEVYMAVVRDRNPFAHLARLDNSFETMNRSS